MPQSTAPLESSGVQVVVRSGAPMLSWVMETRLDGSVEQNHWIERGRATPVANSDATNRPHRSVLSLGVSASHIMNNQK